MSAARDSLWQDAARELLREATERPWGHGHSPTNENAYGVRLPEHVAEPPVFAHATNADAALICRAVNEYEEHLTIEAQARRALTCWHEGIDHDADFLSLEKHLARLDKARANA